MVLVVGVEPTRCCHQRILSPSRLPFRHTSKWKILSCKIRTSDRLNEWQTPSALGSVSVRIKPFTSYAWCKGLIFRHTSIWKILSCKIRTSDKLNENQSSSPFMFGARAWYSALARIWEIVSYLFYHCKHFCWLLCKFHNIFINQNHAYFNCHDDERLSNCRFLSILVMKETYFDAKVPNFA